MAGLDVRTLQRWRVRSGAGDGRPGAVRQIPAHALSQQERARLLEVANEPRFADMPPARIVPTLADEGVYLASESSFSRVLRAAGQSRHRGRARAESVRNSVFEAERAARSSRPAAASRICRRRGSGPAHSCIGTTMIIATAVSATSVRRSAMRGRTGRSWQRGRRCTGRLVKKTRDAGRARPATGRPSGLSRSIPSANVWPRRSVP